MTPAAGSADTTERGDLIHDFLINFSPLLIWIFLQWVVFPKLGVPT